MKYLGLVDGTTCCLRWALYLWRGIGPWAAFPNQCLTPAIQDDKRKRTPHLTQSPYEMSTLSIRFALSWDRVGERVVIQLLSHV